MTNEPSTSPSPEPSARQRLVRSLLGAGSLLALLAAPSTAFAQADVAPAPPNLLLLVDSSGSMDYKTSSDAFPACRYNGSTDSGATSERSRWIELVEVLTGSVNQYECQALNRNSTAFKTEYGGAGNPYDFLYANPYHRAASNGCVPGPGAVDAINRALFLPNAINYHRFDNTASSCVFNQASDGILDAFLNEVRFGLMTFDTDPDPAQSVLGLWSYYVNNSPVVGRPAGCTTDQPQEVGVRNAEAPPWEGRAVGFGNPALGSVDYKTRNAMIQQVLLATRPYGATPIAGMLDDARDYFLEDKSADPIDGSFKFGPAEDKSDPAQDCRPKSIILLSDGQPNMDLRPFCEPSGCPYEKAEDIAENLKTKGIHTYVIGFALASVTVAGVPRKCSSFSDADFDEGNASGICKMNEGDAAIQACCALNRIAAAGGPTPASIKYTDWRRARFADNRDELRAALSNAIGGNLQSTTRTPFVNASGSGFLGAGADLDFARSFQFAAGFLPARLDNPWTGTLTRARWVCGPDPLTGRPTPSLLQPDLDKGDSFIDNVNASGPNARKFFSVVGAAPVRSNATIRPNLPVGGDDGAGTYTGTMDPLGYTATSFVAATSPAAIQVDDSTCDTSTSNKNAAECRDHYLKWLVGLDNGTVFNRCPSVADENCSLIGDIYHSSPRAVGGRPSEFLNDESYQAFSDQQATAKRPSVLYVSTNDGFLHAFKIGAATSDTAEPMRVRTKENNELWAFVPPGVLPGLPAQYPASHQLLLDGTPVIKDVIATPNNAPTYKYRLERNVDDAKAGEGSWRTILVQSFGAGRPGYFALDVTDPVPSVDGTKGPKFLWQLSTAEDGSQLFGSGGATPLITTVFTDEKEVAVAVLPGGFGSAGTDDGAGNGCARKTTDFTDFGTTYPPRAFVPCYTGTAVKARSLTVVRLDSGEILRSFRQDDDEVPSLKAQSVVTEAPIDSPLTGQPVAFPSDVGAVADRVFIGDQDGAVWRLNFASDDGNPEDWKLELFFDGFPGGTFGHEWDEGQPVATPPIISVNNIGNLTVAFSTGDQEAIGSAPGLANYVWSLTEKPNSLRTKLLPQTNWYLGLKGSTFEGDRVIGPMALFAGNLFFSTVGPGDSADVCSSGSGKTFGMHYINPNIEGAGIGGVIAPSLVSAGLINDDGFVAADTLLGSQPRAFLSGATVAQEPSCTSPSTAGDDEYFSNQPHTSFGALTPGRFQLIIPTGSQLSTSTNANVTPRNQGGVNAVVIDLPTPIVTNRVDSWAAIVE